MSVAHHKGPTIKPDDGRTVARTLNFVPAGKPEKLPWFVWTTNPLNVDVPDSVTVTAEPSVMSPDTEMVYPPFPDP